MGTLGKLGRVPIATRGFTGRVAGLYRFGMLPTRTRTRAYGEFFP